MMNWYQQVRDGILVTPYSTVGGKYETLSEHEYDLLERISLELRLDGTHILSCEEAMMAYGKVYDTLLGGKKESSKKSDFQDLGKDFRKAAI